MSVDVEEGDGGRGPAHDGLPPLREVIAAHGLAAKKSLGQNFLLDLNLTGRIARAAGSLDDHDVLEIGPGPGGLTRALLHEGARKVTAVERDSRCLSALAEVAERYPDRLDVLEGDALKLDPIPGLRRPLGSSGVSSCWTRLNGQRRSLRLTFHNMCFITCVS